MKTEPFSDFAVFHQACRGYDLYTMKGTPICKWEAFDLGYRNADRIINGMSPLRAIRKTEEK